MGGKMGEKQKSCKLSKGVKYTAKRVAASALALNLALSGVVVGSFFDFGVIEAQAAVNRTYTPVINFAEDWRPGDGVKGFVHSTTILDKRENQSRTLGIAFIENPNNVQSVYTEGFTASRVEYDGYCLKFTSVNMPRTDTYATIKVTMKDGTEYTYYAPEFAPSYSSGGDAYPYWGMFEGVTASLDVQGSGYIKLDMSHYWDRYYGNTCSFVGERHNIENVWLDGHKLTPGTDYTLFDCSTGTHYKSGERWYHAAQIDTSYLRTLPNGVHTFMIQCRDGEAGVVHIRTSNSTVVESLPPDVVTESVNYDGDNTADVVADVTLGSGETEASGISGVTIDGTALDPSDYVFNSSTKKLTIKDSVLERLTDGTHEVEVTFDNSDATKDTFDIIVTNNEKAPEVLTDSAEYDGENPADVVADVSLGKGDKGASGIDSVSIDGDELDPADYEFDSSTNKLTIKESVLDSLSNGDHAVSVNFDDTDDTTDGFTLIVKNNDKAPSMTEEEEKVSLGSETDVDFNYDLGKNDLAATDIVSVKIDGEEVEFIAEYSTLKIPGSVIKGLINGSHTVEVTFNDDAGTVADNCTIVVESTPSVDDSDKVYDKSNPSDLDWGYDLGSGDKAATDVTEVMIDGEPVDFTLEDGKIVISSDVLVGLENGDHELEIKFNDPDNTTVGDITITVKDTAEEGEAPSLTPSDKEFDKNDPSDVEWPVDLGSGDKGATDVTVKIDGNEVDTSIEDGKIVIPSDVLDGLDEGEHEVEFIFNDSDNTTIDNITITVTDDSGPGSGEDETDKAPSVDTSNKVFNKDNPSDIGWSYDLGSGDKAATDITEIRVNGEPVDFTVEGGKIIIRSDVLAELSDGGYDVEIEFNDPDNTIVDNIKLTVESGREEEERGPSVDTATKTYNKTNPNDVEYTFDLGSGDKAATDIISVTIDGEEVDFEIDGDKLIIHGDSLEDFENGTYEITVIFDDEEGTEDTHAKIKITGKTEGSESESGGDNPFGGNNGGNNGGSTGGSDRKPYRPSNTRPSGGSGSSNGSGNKTTTINDNDVALSGGPDFSNGNGSWEGSGDSWKFKKPDGSYAKSEWITWNGDNYHFNADGFMETGWYLDTTGKWYVLNRDHAGKYGAAITGWYYEKADGKWYYMHTAEKYMLTGWQVIDGKAYYFAETVPQQTYFGNNKDGWVYNASAGLRPYGSMYVNEVTPDGTYVNTNGEK